MKDSFVSITPELASRVRPLFSGDYPVPIRLWAMLDGVIEGRLIMDRRDAPSWALLQEPADGTTYIGGSITAEELAAAVELLRQYGDVVLCHWPQRLPPVGLPRNPDYEGTAIDFWGRTPAVDLEELSTTPDGYTVLRITPDIVPHLQGDDYYVAMFGSIERVLQYTVGFCVMCGAEVVGEAVAGPFVRGTVEIGVGTSESHRRQGLATAAAAWTIRQCEAMGFAAFWNAAEQNVASVALAKRLGFQTAQPFEVLAWSRRVDSSVG